MAFVFVCAPNTGNLSSRRVAPRGERDLPPSTTLSERFTRANRLTKPSDIRAVFNSSQRCADSNFLVLVKKNGLGFARLGMAISKKTVKSAVARNKVKRLVRESFRLNRNSLKGLDLVVLARKNITYKDNCIIGKSLLTHWKRLSSCLN